MPGTDSPQSGANLRLVAGAGMTSMRRDGGSKGARGSYDFSSPLQFGRIPGSFSAAGLRRSEERWAVPTGPAVLVKDRTQEQVRTMNSPTREEMDAKLGAVEARLDAKLATMDSKLDRLADRMEQVITSSREAKEAAYAAQNAAANIKWSFLGTAIAVIAIILAIWALWSQTIQMVHGILTAAQ